MSTLEPSQKKGSTASGDLLLPLFPQKKERVFLSRLCRCEARTPLALRARGHA